MIDSCSGKMYFVLLLLLICNLETVLGGCAITPDANGNVVIPAIQTSIANDAFKECSTLKTVAFASDSVLETIGNYSFSSSGLTAITMPSSVKLIDRYAFQYCSSLATVTFPSNSVLETIGSYAFFGTALTAITVPSTVKVIDQKMLSVVVLS